MDYIDHLRIKGQLHIRGILRLNGGIIYATPFWTFDTPTTGTTLSEMKIKTIPSTTVTVDWGDDTSSTVLPEDTSVSHTY